LWNDCLICHASTCSGFSRINYVCSDTASRLFSLGQGPPIEPHVMMQQGTLKKLKFREWKSSRKVSLMDIILEVADQLLLDCFWSRIFPIHPNTGTYYQRCPSRFTRDHSFRQSVSIFIITLIGIVFLYFFLGT
jgi:hypothetical protein